MTDEDFEQAPYLLPLKDMLEECDFLYEIKPSENISQNLFFIQDKFMQIFFDYYPELICVDVLCELTKLKLKLYVFIGIDANGSCEIIALGFLKSSDVGIQWLCDTFKKHNRNFENIKIILSNKILRGNNVFRKAFSGRPILTSFFHLMQSLKKELSRIGLRGNNENTKKFMMIFEKMYSASSKSEWSNLLEELKHCNKALSKNYRKFRMKLVQDEIKEQWILNKKFDFKLFWRSFNILLLSIRKSLRPNICSLDTIEEILKFCSSFIKNSRMEKFQKLRSTFQKPVVKEVQVAFFNYSQILTPFATKLIIEQISISNYVTIIIPTDIIKQGFDVNKQFCTCCFFEFLSLPCCHVFGVRKSGSYRLFEESLCSTKWLKSSYKKVLIELFNVFFEQIVVTSYHEVKKYFGRCAEVVPYERPDGVSEQRFTLLQHLITVWDRELNIVVLGSPSAGISSDSSYFRFLRNYRSGESLADDTFKLSYGISLNDILNCDDRI